MHLDCTLQASALHVARGGHGTVATCALNSLLQHLPFGDIDRNFGPFVNAVRGVSNACSELTCVLTTRIRSADDVGDMFFDMLEVLPYPIACPNGTNTTGCVRADPPPIPHYTVRTSFSNSPRV